jgi:hypothetical protein
MSAASPKMASVASVALPALIDCAGIARELGVKRPTAERIMRLCSAKVPLGRRVFVYREEVARVIQEREVRDAA